MNRIEKMIPDAIESVAICIASHGNVDKAFSGYISSLGASITTAGLLPTLIFFSDKGGSQADRPAVIKAIEYILTKYGYIQANEKLLEKVKIIVDQSAYSQLSRCEELISDAAVALKLSIRTFPKN
jgi:CRISPR/Cas system CMR-associated protein Cmr5 small subunit